MKREDEWERNEERQRSKLNDKYSVRLDCRFRRILYLHRSEIQISIKIIY